MGASNFLQHHRLVTQLHLPAATTGLDRYAEATFPRRLLFLSTNMGMGGGAEEQVIDLAYAFKDRGWDVSIVSLLPPMPMPEDFEGRGIALEHLDMRRAIPDPRAMFRLQKIIRKFRPDIVHAHMNHANLVARAVRLIEPFPVLISTLHALDMAGVQRDWSRLFEIAHQVTDGLSDRTTAICHAAADNYRRKHAVSSKRMMVVHNGIDTGRYMPNVEARGRIRQQMGIDDDFVWVAAGRLELAKAYPTLLNAMACLKIQPKGAGKRTLLICGKGTLQSELEKLSARLGVSNQVKFLGLRRDMPELLSAADGFALSSNSEGLPLVLLQAATACLPIVATRVGGNPEVVNHQVNGLLSAAGDGASFANAMARIEALSASDRLKMGLAGQRHVLSLFQRKTVVDQWELLFNELYRINGGQPRRRAGVATCQNA